MKTNGLMRIGELSRRSGASIRAIRYYEERGLLQPAARTKSNYRLYDQRALRILTTMRRLKMLGMSLDNIAELREIYGREGECTDQLRERLLHIIGEHLQRIEHQIEELNLLKNDLSHHFKRLVEYLASQNDENLNLTCQNSLGIS